MHYLAVTTATLMPFTVQQIPLFQANSEFVWLKMFLLLVFAVPVLAESALDGAFL
jgi:hypothetical protein